MEIQSLPYEEMLVSPMAHFPEPGNWYCILRVSWHLLRGVKVSEGVTVYFSGGSSPHVPAMLKERSTTVHAISFDLASAWQNCGSEEAKAKIHGPKAVSCGMLEHQPSKYTYSKPLKSQHFHAA